MQISIVRNLFIICVLSQLLIFTDAAWAEKISRRNITAGEIKKIATKRVKSMTRSQLDHTKLEAAKKLESNFIWALQVIAHEKTIQESIRRQCQIIINASKAGMLLKPLASSVPQVIKNAPKYENNQAAQLNLIANSVGPYAPQQVQPALHSLSTFLSANLNGVNKLLARVLNGIPDLLKATVSSVVGSLTGVTETVIGSINSVGPLLSGILG